MIYNTALWVIFTLASQKRKSTDAQIWRFEQASLQVAPTTSTQILLTEMQSHDPANCKGGWEVQVIWLYSREEKKIKSLLQEVNLKLIIKYINITLK